jgi:hypothetical protein
VNDRRVKASTLKIGKVRMVGGGLRVSPLPANSVPRGRAVSEKVWPIQQGFFPPGFYSLANRLRASPCSARLSSGFE